MAGLFFGNRRGHYFYVILLKNANVRLRFANRTYAVPQKSKNLDIIIKCEFIKS